MADTIRQKRVSQAIMRTVSTILLREYGDGPIASAMVSRVRITSDLREATIYFTCYGDADREEVETLLGEEASRIRFLMAREISHLKHVPELTFRFDDGVEKMMNLERVFDKIKKERDE